MAASTLNLILFGSMIALAKAITCNHDGTGLNGTDTLGIVCGLLMHDDALRLDDLVDDARERLDVLDDALARRRDLPAATQGVPHSRGRTAARSASSST